MAGISHAAAPPGMGERLARIAGGEHIDRFDAFPADLLDIAEVRDAGPAPLEDGGGVPVCFGVPDEFAVVVVLGGEVEAAVAAAHAADGDGHVTRSLPLCLGRRRGGR